MEKVNKSGSIFVLLCSILLASLASGPGQAKAPADENLAVIIGESGEQYPIYGAGGIRVSGGHHGIWMSNMKRSAIEIDGSGISAQRLVQSRRTLILPHLHYRLISFQVRPFARYLPLLREEGKK